MKAEELMIGDWVMHEGHPYQIRQLGIYGEDRDGNDYPAVCIGKPQGIGLIVERNEISPISITSEILEQNGFKKVEDIGFSLYCKDKNGFGMYHIYYHHHYYLDIDGYVRGIGTFEGVNIQYIHQLQQAMHLCGITKEIKI